MATNRNNIAALEHINLNADNPLQMCHFYIDGLGFVQDPRMGELVEGKMYINSIVWLNAGINQIHMPLTNRGGSGAKRNILRGTIGLAYDDIDALCVRLEGVQEKLQATRFRWTRQSASTVEIFSPVGNRFLAHLHDRSFRDTRGYHPGPLSFCLGMAYVEFDCPVSTARAILLYYETYFGGCGTLSEDGCVAIIKTGDRDQCTQLRFREKNGFVCTPEKPYHLQDYGLHICLYLYDQPIAMRRLAKDKLLWGNPRFDALDQGLGMTQFRNKDIVDPMDSVNTGRNVLMELEHEVRVMTHQTSPFGNGNGRPYSINDRVAVPVLISSVTDKFEHDDFEMVAAKKNAHKIGYIPLSFKPIEFYTWDTPNGKKVSILLEELGLDYVVKTVHIGQGEQNTEEFVRISPNSKIPAIRDPNITDVNGECVTLFESAAIMLHLVEHYGTESLVPKDAVRRAQCMQWLFFQVGGFGPIPGQLHHFLSLSGANTALVTSDDGFQAKPEATTYALERFTKEVHRLYGVMDKWLSSHEYFVGDLFTIADIAIFSWVWRAPKHKVDLAKQYPSVKRWYDVLMARPGVQRGLLVPSEHEKVRPPPAKMPRL